MEYVDRSGVGSEGGAPYDHDVMVDLGAVRLPGRLTVPAEPVGAVVFAHGRGSSHHSPRNQRMAAALNDVRIATLLLDLLSPEEGTVRANNFDIPLLGRRLLVATQWLHRQPGLAGVPVGYVGAHTGAAAAFWAATEADEDIVTVVSRGGRPDLADARLHDVRCPVLLVVGGDDDLTLTVNREALFKLHCEVRLAIVPGATHYFSEPGTLDAVATLARDWFVRHLNRTSLSSR